MYPSNRLSKLLSILSVVVGQSSGRQACVPKDACLRAASIHINAANNCFSFFSTTVSLCPFTTTLTTTHVVAAPTPTLTSVSTSTSTAVSTDEVVVLTTKDFFATSYLVSTAYATTFVTSTLDVLFHDKRAPGPRSAVADGEAALQQQVSSCTPITRQPTKVPAYASSQCRGLSSAYSSACSCLDIYPSVVTLPQRTITKYVTATTTTSTPPPYVVQQTDIVDVRSVFTSFSTSVVSTTLPTVATTTTTIVSTETAIAYCRKVKLVAIGGQSQGKYFKEGRLPNYNYYQVQFGNSSQATVFTLQDNGDGTQALVAPNGQAIAAEIGFERTNLFLNPGFTVSNGVKPLTCTVSFSGRVICSVTGGSVMANIFMECTNNDQEDGVQEPLIGDANGDVAGGGYGCQSFTLTAIEQC